MNRGHYLLAEFKRLNKTPLVKNCLYVIVPGVLKMKIVTMRMNKVGMVSIRIKPTSKMAIE